MPAEARQENLCIEEHSRHATRIGGMMIFANRDDAAKQLATALSEYRNRNPLVLAIPRGAVPMAKIIADELNGEFDVVLVRKLGAPGNPEFAIGSVDETGWVYVADYAERVGVSKEYIKNEAARQLEVIRRRRHQYTPVRPPIDPSGRIVIVVDDGLATGSTMISALHALRSKNPAELICAVPVAPPDTVEKVSASADRVVCLSQPINFRAVAQFYEEFPQVTDEEVIDALSASGHSVKD
jgi:putative phosphoribosyl transferase